jgi:hypothetical protein
LSGTTINWALGSAGMIFTWTGAVSTDWNNPRNWNFDLVPSSADTVIIPPGCPNYSAMEGSISLKSLTINAGTSINMSGNSFSVTQSLVINGTFYASSASVTVGGNITGSGLLEGASPVISAEGYIGTLDNPLETLVSGTLTMSASSMNNYTSINLSGTGAYSFNGATAGFVFVNGHLLEQVGQQNIRATIQQGESGPFGQEAPAGFFGGGVWIAPSISMTVSAEELLAGMPVGPMAPTGPKAKVPRAKVPRVPMVPRVPIESMSMPAAPLAPMVTPTASKH